MSPDEAREFFGGELPQAYRNIPQQSGGGFQIDRRALAYAMVAFLLFLGSLMLYFKLTGATQVIEPMEAGTIELVSREYPEVNSELQTISNRWNAGDLEAAVSSINTIIEDAKEQSSDLAKQLYLLKIKGMVVQEKNAQAARFGQYLQSQYPNDEMFLAEVYWYRGHSYYYRKRYYDAINAFDQVVLLGGTHADQAQQYLDKIRDVVDESIFSF